MYILLCTNIDTHTYTHIYKFFLHSVHKYYLFCVKVFNFHFHVGDVINKNNLIFSLVNWYSEKEW